MDMSYLKEIKYENFIVGNEVTFVFNDGSTYIGKIIGSLTRDYYIHFEEAVNSIIFDKLNIDTRYFIKDLGIKCYTGVWPEVESLHDLHRIVIALYKVNKPIINDMYPAFNSIGLKSKFVIGTTNQIYNVSIGEHRSKLYLHFDDSLSLCTLCSELGIRGYLEWLKRRGLTVGASKYEVESLYGIRRQLEILLKEFPQLFIEYNDKIYNYCIHTSNEKEVQIQQTYEIKLQRKVPLIDRGTRPEGSRVCGRKCKTTVAVGHLSYSAKSV